MRDQKDTYARLIVSLLQSRLYFDYSKYLLFLKYCVTQNCGDILK